MHVYAHGEVDGRLYLATQLVPGGDLGAMLRHHGAPPATVALDLVAQVASGLADAHAAGLVHRDIKPANVLLRRRGDTMSAYLGDFGISRRLHAEDPEDVRTGTVGTPSLMAPELHTGGEAGVASDVYALGCLLWSALSGHAPYRGATECEVVRAHLEQPIPQLPGRLAAGDRGQPDPAHRPGEGPGRPLPVGGRAARRPPARDDAAGRGGSGAAVRTGRSPRWSCSESCSSPAASVGASPERTRSPLRG